MQPADDFGQVGTKEMSMLSNYLHAFWVVFGVVVVAELCRQTWRRERCRNLAERGKAERHTHSHDHNVVERAIGRIRELADIEAFARVVAFGIKAMLSAFALVWTYAVVSNNWSM
jgi:hypothetical protein